MQDQVQNMIPPKKRPMFIDLKLNTIKKSRAGMIYANLVDAKTGNTEISAELNYIIKVANERNMEITNLQGALGLLMEHYDVVVGK